MKKSWLIIILIIIGFGGLYFFSKSHSPQETNSNQASQNTQTPVSSSQYSQNTNPETQNLKADTIEVVHFHATQQCWSCITVGKYALKTIEEKFPDEYANGKIVYKDINVESPENKEIARRYQATGASLYINAIKNGKDFIEEDTTVWRLINSESQYTTYFEGKLKTLLGT
ncbi:hypothetical protein CO015_04765 [candidate division WWE3 bacterium CG_4_8_14_3_um_filter_42_11]|uniref:Uncharacterized protein n=1 Tax=candidate division WWE3 bacterium CG_4_8_14_3_um_filter_42_11 TaxID=1975076 RepID=A0A2M8G698_UNCKA|nr:MAG: hypothetical protein CO015_04765 [candidate division WWE3 bacterium CG_4_8_14_3_um_filter_42_11]